MNIYNLQLFEWHTFWTNYLSTTAPSLSMFYEVNIIFFFLSAKNRVCYLEQNAVC